MQKLESLTVPQTVQNLIDARTPTRVAVLVRINCPWYPHSADEIVKEVCSILGLLFDDGYVRLLVIEKWDRLNVFAFDIFYDNYDNATAHNVVNLPVVLVDCGKRYSVIKEAKSEFRTEVNATVAGQQNSNGWDTMPPYIADHTGGKVPTYMNPRSLKKASSEPDAKQVSATLSDSV